MSSRLRRSRLVWVGTRSACTSPLPRVYFEVSAIGRSFQLNMRKRTWHQILADIFPRHIYLMPPNFEMHHPRVRQVPFDERYQKHRQSTIHPSSPR